MIRVELHYCCGGCHAKESVETWLKREFRSFSGRDHGWGTHSLTPSKQLVEETCPKDWISFDPYTGATYCPKCWSEIVDGIEPAKGEEG